VEGPQGLPLFKPPYGRITAIDLSTGNRKWMTPHGDGPRTHPAIKHLNLPNLGINRRGFLIVTKTLLIAAQEGSWFNETPPKYPAYLRAFDKSTGKLIAQVPLPAHATGQPIKKVEKDTDRDFWLSGPEAIEYGLATHMITSMSELK